MNNLSSSSTFSILLRSMFERKILIIVTTSIFVIFALLIMLPKNKLYESEAIFVIGTYPDLENQVVYLEKDKQLAESLLARYPTISHIDPKGFGYVVIHVTGSMASEAQASLNKILKEVLTDHNVRYNQVRELYRKKLEYYLDQEKLIKANISNFSFSWNKQGNISEEQKSLHFIFYLERLKSIGDRLDQIEEKAFQYEQLLALDFKPTHVIKEPTLPLKPKRPKTLKYLILSFVLGLLVSFFTVFCLAYRDYIINLFKNSAS